MTGSVSVGAVLDENPAAIADQRSGALLDPRSERKTDGAGILAGEMRIEHTLPTGHGDLLFLDTRGWVRQQFDVEIADYVSGRIRAGGVFFAGDLSITPFAHYGAYTLDDELFLQESGGGINLGYPVTPRLELLGEVLALHEEFDDTDLNRYGAEQSGTYVAAGGGFSFELTPTDTIRFKAHYLDKSADLVNFDYHGYELQLFNHLDLGAGQYLDADLRYRHRDFAGPDPSMIFAPDREDDQVIARLAYGLPLGTLAKAIGAPPPPALADLNLQLGITYYSVDSNDDRFEVDKFAGDFLMTKRFAF